MFLSIIIVTWNSQNELPECLSSLRNQDCCQFELIIVDNGSSDQTVATAHKLFPQATVVCNDENEGFAAACNIGIERAHGEWVGLLNPDTMVNDNWVSSLQEASLRASPRTGMLQPLILFKKDHFVNSTGIKLTLSGGASDRGFRTSPASREWGRDVFCPSAGAALYRRATLESVKMNSGYLDSGFFMYWEDVDLGWRCRLAGWEARYVPEIQVYHEYQGSSKHLGNKFVQAQIAINRVASIGKNASFLFLLATVPRTIWDLMLGLCRGNWPLLGRMFRSFWYGVGQRPEVNRLMIKTRRSVERDWAGR